MSELYRRSEEVLSQYLEDCELGILSLSEAKEKAIKEIFTTVAGAVAEYCTPYSRNSDAIIPWLRTQAEGKE